MGREANFGWSQDSGGKRIVAAGVLGGKPLKRIISGKSQPLRLTGAKDNRTLTRLILLQVFSVLFEHDLKSDFDGFAAQIARQFAP